MQRHPVIGYEILKDSPSKYLRMGALIALGHHEKFDGSGYPYGLVGDHIPLPARIVAVADVYDALTSKRSYKSAWLSEEALKYLQAHRRTHFDPALVDAFLGVRGEALAIQEELKDVLPSGTRAGYGAHMIQRLRACVRRVAARLKSRPDSEHEQALVRLALTTAILLYLAFAEVFGHGPTRHPLLVYALIAMFLMASVGILVEIYRRPEACPRRRFIAMVADNTAITTCMCQTTFLGAPLFGVFLFVTFGNGFRYGRLYLFASQALAIGGFTTVLFLNPFWRNQLPLGLGLMFSLIVLPLYVSTLLTRIQKARAAAEAANIEKTRFLSTMSHEMRTPLNGVIGINELLFATPLTTEQRELLASSQSSAELMLSLVNNVLDISRIESGRIELERAEFDLHKLLHTTIRPLALQAERKHLQLHLNVAADVPYQLVGSPVHVRQILANLVSNAIKFTDEGSVSVRVLASQRSGGPGSCSFRD